MDQSLSKVQSIRGLSKAMRADETILEEVRNDPVGAIEQVMRNELPNTQVYRMVVWALGATLIVSLAGTITLSYGQIDIPDLLVAANAGALGALAGIVTQN
ncbi:hypothetical protein [Roseobacter weihaiensis]|uniref:hypothetical protein n=1 Tax=Roseobacter weihaiensis TaxID=2763262 RepID=UPI001D0A8EE9|nr:hypothetical protein [Roseobacter sp. H9]